MNLLWMYDDLLDLFGDRGNITIMEHILKKAGEEVIIDKKSRGDEIDFSRYNFVYIGSGTVSNLAEAAEDFNGRREAVLEAINNGTPFLITGSAQALFSAGFTSIDGYFHKGLELTEARYDEKSKITIHDITACRQGNDELVYGFINTSLAESESSKDPLFTVRSVDGAAPQKDQDPFFDGTRIKNCFLTSFLGPVLVKNPGFLSEIASLVCGRQVDIASDNIKTAYNLTIKELFCK